MTIFVSFIALAFSFIALALGYYSFVTIREHINAYVATLDRLYSYIDSLENRITDLEKELIKSRNKDK